jgi:hypothetical protein
MSKRVTDDINNRITEWVRAYFRLPDDTEIVVDRSKDDHPVDASKQTAITLHIPSGHDLSFIVRKPPDRVSERDVKRLRWLYLRRRYPFMAPVLRFVGWWFGFAGLYAMTAACPCCGQIGCPVGASGAGVVGGILALVMQNGSTLMNRIKRKS